MPSHLHRFQNSGNLHFLTFSCHDRNPYLNTLEIREVFESSLEAIRRRYVIRVYGYVLMPEHVHLLLSEPKRRTLDIAIQALKLSVSKQSSHHPFWLPRYYDFNVQNEEKLIEKLKYIHRNPVTRGLVSSPQDWKCSSFCHYQTGAIGIVEIESFWTASRREKLTVLTTASDPIHE